MSRYCLALDLVNDASQIAAYIEQHQRIWPEIAAHIRATGVTEMEIWHLGTRLFMVMDVDGSYSAERAAALAASTPKVAEWEALMWTYQVPTPWAQEGEKWALMTQIFALNAQA
ncbi:L-rhamnose mutarotase [Vitreoscilla massiliensis]|uniref:L-rhamnose mutarotase n=1 Tax=Vitreoscilla massiliensis TaxID=1689272 RepID=A0ABY4E2T4_9NEIS|nr:L-rhamnose mutarotase [Vitreoscilla massiliensis]UOO90076.1 L-rhamnose mutarotase [Vitreoscilla massiliensis]